MLKCHYLLITSFVLFSMNNLLGQQRPSAQITKIPSGTSISIDALVDDIWNDVTGNAITKPFGEEVPTISNASWKGLYDDTALFILITYTDDDWAPDWNHANLKPWTCDKIEIVFDVDNDHTDNIGAIDMIPGQVQAGPNFTEDDAYSQLGCSLKVHPLGKLNEDSCFYSLMYSASEGVGQSVDFWAEFVFPFSQLRDSTGKIIPNDHFVGKTIGFDVSISDNIPEPTSTNTKQRAVWANVGLQDESWRNLNDVGEITFVPENTSGNSNSIVHKMNCYPNPVLDNLNFTQKMDKVIVYSILGQPLMIEQMISHINLSYLPSGMYIINMQKQSDNRLARIIKK